ncbi:MAG: hypothetical protein AB1656_03550 [Candidatus Omnitrophota bacterium]
MNRFISRGLLAFLFLSIASQSLLAEEVRHTRLSIEKDRWLINGQSAYPGAKADGLLLNVRMVNSTFEDLNRRDFDPDKNTEAFLPRIPDYYASGVRAFTLNLQGGMPGYEGALNSAFNPDGSLRDEYLHRVKRVIEACDRQGIAVILGLFYQRQDQILKNDDAVRKGVVNAVRWIEKEGFTNVAVEIANEYGHDGFDRSIIKSPAGEVELIQLAKQTAPRLFVSTSGLGDGLTNEKIAEAADFILLHFNGAPVEKIPDCISLWKKYSKPIVCNEDDKTGEEAAKAAEISVLHGCSYGLMLKEINQYQPFQFQGTKDDPAAYEKFRKLSTP